ncbi:MAG TPA: SDR family NAD(P)-dependent oxidoreductase, partial [Spongiibacteraceae bacterium]|nr:SDR family NAD(P)-dependent oxidoreductase [Spongiibacteraceae bacterium]
MKRALVTGGSGEIGAAICQRLAMDGLFVFVHANRNLDSAQRIVDAIVAAGGSARAVQFDVANAAQTLTVLTELLDEAPIQVIVNNAGIHNDAVLPGMTAQQWHSV